MFKEHPTSTRFNTYGIDTVLKIISNYLIVYLYGILVFIFGTNNFGKSYQIS